jgi:SAM-dependent methyltransferase
MTADRGWQGTMIGVTLETQKFWDAEADTFDDEADHGLRDAAVRGAWSRLLLPLLPDVPASVADLGCGTGSLSVLLAQAGYDVAGLDLSPRMVEAAGRKARATGAAAQFVVGDASEPRLPAGSFDVVLARHVLWALPDPGAALKNWLHLLKAGGMLLLVEGRWATGGGLTSAEVCAHLRAQGQEPSMTRLDDPQLWGRSIDDDRCLVVSRSTPTTGGVR